MIGTESPDGESLPLRVGGRDLGVLRVSARGPGETYTDADRHLLTALAPPVAVAVRALELADALEVEHRRVLTATRAERERVRHELHDGLLSRLFGIRMGLTGVDDALRTGDSDAARTQLAAMRTAVRDANEETRRIAAAQRPIALDEWGLVPAIRGHTVAASGPTVTVTAELLPVLSPQVEEAAYHIAIEAMTNAARHADGSRIDVELAVDGDDLVLTVSDDGSGGRSAPEGIGLSSMRSRAAGAGGKLDLDIGPTGTTVTATLRLEEP
ncbi:hypothetical protein Abr02nite_30040 [Paractinoplanes brasiliensis]|nr:hypothetical protein Abr02nite_30040 [Actinoplanes brasiliensis]